MKLLGLFIVMNVLKQDDRFFSEDGLLLRNAVYEAAMQMELLGHTFYVFLNVENDSVSVVYKRADNDYGVLQTTY